jgi:DNA polymerase III alpha subunit
MQFLTLEDETGLVECTVFPKMYERLGHRLDGIGPYTAKGRLEDNHGALCLNVEEMGGVGCRL